MVLKEITLVLLLSSCIAAQVYKDLRTIFEWKSLEFEFPTDHDRQYAIDNGIYQQNAGTPIDIAVEYKANSMVRIFQTIPRFSDGIPFSLATVTKRSTPNGPILKAYPNYHMHNVNNAGCGGITSAFRVEIDECQRMWVMDSGAIKTVQMCPPQLLVFDLKTDRLISRFPFPLFLFTPSESLFVSLAVDIRDPPPLGTCSKAMVYMADMKRGALVVYNSERNNAWRVENPLMLANPAWGTHTIGGQTFELMNGIFSLSLSPRGDATRYLFFHVQADDRECAVTLRHIDNPMSTLRAGSSQFQVLGSRGVQSAMEAIDSKGNIFTSTNDPLSIFAWNINTPYNRRAFKVVADNPDQLQFVSGMKVVKSPFGDDQLWVVTSSYQKAATNTRNYSEVNFRVTFCLTDDLLTNGRCTDTVSQDLSTWIYEDVDPNKFWV